MSVSTQISATMAPALNPLATRPNLGNVAYVPSLRVELLAEGHRPFATVALIDTGADMSLVDSSSFAAFYGAAPNIKEHSVVTAELATGGQQQIRIYHLGVRLIGDDPDIAIEFGSVPIGVAEIKRPMILGRRGLLEWLSLQVDFVSHRITVTRPSQRAIRYPSLAHELPTFQSVLDQIDSGNTAAVLTLAWEVERFIDRLVQEREPLRQALQRIPKRERTFRRILETACRGLDLHNLLPQCETLAMARNTAAHEPAERLSISITDVLEAAEQIVEMFAQARSGGQTHPEGIDVNRLESILRRSPRSFTYLRDVAGFSLTDEQFDDFIDHHSDRFARGRVIDRDKQGKRKIPGRKGIRLRKKRN